MKPLKHGEIKKKKLITMISQYASEMHVLIWNHDYTLRKQAIYIWKLVHVIEFNLKRLSF